MFKKYIINFKKQIWFHMFVLGGVIFLLIFSYIPMFGIIIAFKNYSIVEGIRGFFTSKWVGFAHFIEFFSDYRFWNILTNTIGISFVKILFTFPAPIIFALMLNEVRNMLFKRLVQTVSYLPYFISWVIVVGIAGAFLSETRGVINQILLALGIISKPIPFLTDPKYFWWLTAITATWKETGWWAIIYLAAIASIDPNLYEAAEIDGATRIQKIIYITLPAIKGTIIVVAILTIGNFLGGGLVGGNFEQCYLFGNSLNNWRSEIIQTYSLKMGLMMARFDYATAIGLFQSIISLILILTANSIARKISQRSLF